MSKLFISRLLKVLATWVLFSFFWPAAIIALWFWLPWSWQAKLVVLLVLTAFITLGPMSFWVLCPSGSSAYMSGDLSACG